MNEFDDYQAARAAMLKRADDTCAADPACARTRMAMLRTEKKVAAKGWDQAPTMWRAHARGDGSVYFEYAKLTDALHTGMDKTGDTGEALDLLAHFVKTQAAPLFRLLNDTPADADLVGDAPGAFLGYALMCEAWTVHRKLGMTDAELASRQAAYATKKLHEHPDRAQVRTFYFADIHGRFWALYREEGQDPFVLVSEPGTDELVGLVPDALIRLTAAAAGESASGAKTEAELRDFQDGLAAALHKPS